MEKADTRRRPRAGKAPRKINQADIARRAEVSISTVSRALSGAPGTRPEVRARILEIASSMGYSVPEGAPEDRVTVLLPMHPVTGGLHQVFQECLDGVKQEAADRGLQLFPYLLPESEITAERIRAYLVQHQSNAVLLFYADAPAPAEQMFRDRGALVMINNCDSEMRFDSILPDNANGARRATEHLVAAGHRRIAFLIGNTRCNPQQRLAGFQAACSGRDDLQPEVISIGYDREETAYLHFREVFANGGRPDWTALLCANDLMALGVLQAARETGLDVPGDISLVGFDNIGWSQMTTPRLTTLSVDRREMGREAVRLLCRRLARPDAPVQCVQQGATFIDGDSVGPPRSEG